jgi:threonine dehydratase
LSLASPLRVRISQRHRRPRHRLRADRIYFSDTHTLAEGAGAATLAALMKERARMQGRRVGLVMSGQNVDRSVMSEVLAGRVPE